MAKSEKNMIDSGMVEMVDKIPIGLYKSTPGGKFIIVNNFMVEMFGFKSKKTMINCDISSLYYSKEERDKLFHKFEKSDTVKDHEVKLKKFDGTPFYGSVSERIIRDKSGKIEYVYGILEDISEKKNKEEELLKLATLVTQAAVSIVLTDIDGNIQYVNPWFKTVTGYSEDEVKEKNPRVLKSENSNYPENYFKAMWESITNGEIWQGQFTNTKKSGEDYIEEATIFPISSGKEKKILGFGAVKKDITKQIELEMELELSLREMVKLKERAESASKLKSIFLANMSHDIRTPLNAIIGFSDLLKKNKLDNKLNRYVDNIVRSGDILLNLINDILDLSKIEAGEMNIIKNSFFIKELIENMKSVFKVQFKEKKIKFRTEIAKNLPEKLHSDQSRIQQILINLLSNSLKFTIKGEVVFKIEYDKREDLLTFSVKDSGIGIPVEFQDKLFTPFFSNRNQDNINETSTGLGLAICKDLAELLKGNIKMTSQSGVGSEFILELPANTSEVEEVFHLNENLYGIASQEGANLANKSILIAEDNEVNAELLIEALEMRGFRNITVVENGEEAIQAAITQLPQLIIMDNKMPKLSGLESLKVLRERGFESPVIILTADALEEIKEKEISVMPESYLTKPINFELLFSEICRILKLKEQNNNKTITSKTKDIKSMLKIDKNISEKIKSIFLKDLKEKKGYLDRVIENNSIKEELETLSSIAHTYKGNSGYFGLTPFESLAKELDKELKANEFEDIITELVIALDEIITDIISINS